MNICVFCAATKVDPLYSEPARELAYLIAKNGHSLVWGGSDRGLMKTMAETAQANGGKIIGISMESLKHSARDDADVMIITKDLSERKKVMLDHSDAIITLVGGTGTLDEMTELLELKRHGTHSKPLVILNTAGFYNGLRDQWDRMKQEGFLDRLPVPIEELIQFVNTPAEVMDIVNGNVVSETFNLTSKQWMLSPEAV